MAPANRKSPSRSKSSDSQYSIMEFMKDFPDDEACLQWLWKTRCETSEPGHAHCLRCEEIRPFKRYNTAQQRQSWTCTACGYHLHPTAGTIFHKSSTSLHLWFYAMWLITSTRCGISAKALGRELGVTYKTAWRMFNLIRNELMGSGNVKLSGRVEMDETYVGGKPRLSDKKAWAESTSKRQAGAQWAADTKVGVFGMVERNKDGQAGQVVAYVIPKKPQAAIVQHIETHVSTDVVLYTDDSRLYTRLADKGFEHYRINHSAGIYVKGHIHTQQIEGFWSLVKRGISGTYHSVSKKWLESYVNEYAWRYNRREDPQPMFVSMITRAAQS